jgi:CRISPR/Cas system CMR-associated protein Cmr5 small subunit
VTAPRRDHGIAQAAWTAVSGVPDKTFPKYRSRVLQLPVMLRSSGLVASLACLASKGEEHKTLADQVAKHIGPIVSATGAATPGSVIAALTAGTPAGQRRAEEAARMYADWLKRSVESRKHQAKPALAEGLGDD